MGQRHSQSVFHPPLGQIPKIVVAILRSQSSQNGETLQKRFADSAGEVGRRDQPDLPGHVRIVISLKELGAQIVLRVENGFERLLDERSLGIGRTPRRESTVDLEPERDVVFLDGARLEESFQTGEDRRYVVDAGLCYDFFNISVYYVLNLI